MTIATMRGAIATALRTIDGLTNVSEYLQDQIKPPHAMLDLGVTPHTSFGRAGTGLSTYNFKVYVYANRVADEASQKFLDTMRDPESTGSVIYVLENDSTLAAAVGDCVTVKSASETQISTPPNQGVEYQMIVFEVEVVL